MSDTMDAASMLTEQVDRLLAASVDRKMLLASEAGTFPYQLWRSLEDLGLALALVPEELGGSGLSWIDVEGALNSVGYHVAPVPLAEVMVAAWSLGAAGIEPGTGILVPLEDVLEIGASGAISGVAANVPWAAAADHFVAVAKGGDKHFVCLLDAKTVSIKTASSIGRDPRAVVSMLGAVPEAISEAPAKLRGGLRPALAVARSAQIAGALSRALEMAVEHANTRVQFGKSIGKFQALQHMMAEFACEAAAAGVAAAMALRSFGTDRSDLSVAAAKIRCGIAATKGAASAHAIHGAMGVTDEHSLHYVTRRLWQWRDDAGSEHDWAEDLGRRVLAQPGAALWRTIVSMG